MCKIHKAGRFVFAVAGYNILEMVQDAKKTCLKYRNFDSIINSFQTSFTAKLHKALTKTYRANKKHFQELIDKEDALSTVYFIGSADGKLYLVRVTFEADLYDNRIGITPDAVTINYGASGHINELADTLESPSLWEKGIVRTMTYLIKKQAKIHPIEVGGYIDIIKVTLKGSTWIRKKKTCR